MLLVLTIVVQGVLLTLEIDRLLRFYPFRTKSRRPVMVKKMSNGQWTTAITKLAALFVKVDHSIHELGCVAMATASETFDARRMLELYKVLGQSARKKGFLVWVEMFSPIRITDSKEKGVTVKLAKQGDPGYAPFDVAGAEARPFWTLAEAEEKTVKPLSADAFLKLIYGYKSKLEKAAEKGTPIEGDVTQLNTLVDNVIADASRRRAQLEVKAAPAPVKSKLVKEQVPQQKAA